jgi:hypothetical protein
VACNPSTYRGEEHVLARVDDDYLFESDLEGIIPEGSSARDSLIIVRNFINNWVKQKLLVKQAERNLTRAQKDFSKQMEEYRNSLVIYEYEKKFIQQELDTIVSQEEIENYFNQFKHNFMTREDIYQVEYIVMDQSSTMIPYFRELLGSDSPDKMDTLEYLCPAHALRYNLDNNKWFTLSDIQRKFPFYAFHQTDFSEVNEILDITKEEEIYLMVIRQYLAKGDTAPLGYISEDIREIIINKRKAELVNTMHEGVMNQAIQKKTFEIY